MEIDQDPPEGLHEPSGKDDVLGARCGSLHSLGKFCVLGTDGRAADAVRPAGSLERLFRFSEVDEDLVDCAGRERLDGIFSGSLSGLEGFDDEYLLW